MFGKNNCCCDSNRQEPFMMMNQPCMEQQVVEPVINKCVEKEFYHEVPHV